MHINMYIYIRTYIHTYTYIYVVSNIVKERLNRINGGDTIEIQQISHLIALNSSDTRSCHVSLRLALTGENS